jgi:thiamine-phosphate pyrophosphorylase
MRTIKDRSLYLIISEECCAGRSPLEIARAAVAGGVDILQMREKNRSLRELVALGNGLSGICKSGGAMFIVNDDPALVRIVGADGVHLGQEDIRRFSLKMAREMIGPERIIGLSTHSPGQFEKAMGEDIDYAAFGPVFPTKTKDYNIGTGDIARVAALARKPVFFIGGIELSNVDEILGRGGRNIALIRGIAEAGDPEAMARELKGRMIGPAPAEAGKI